MKKLLTTSAVILFLAAGQTANAAEVIVEMLSRDKATNTSNVYKPTLVRIAKGDTVKWKATQSGHNVAFMAGGIPAGAPNFSSGFDKEIKFQFDKPGLYLYKCTPHMGTGMVGLVLVANDKSNLAAVKAVYLPPAAKRRLEPAFAELAKP